VNPAEISEVTAPSPAPVADVAAYRRRADRLRLLVVESLQIPAIALAIWGVPPTAAWCAALWGSAVCCAGTDSHWRWRNRVLIAQAVAWLLQALLR
jgi:branched-subunit amino acid transport protein